MTRRKNPNTVLREAKIQQTLEGIESGLYSSARHAEKETGLPHTILSTRLRGTRPRNKAHEDQQLFTHSEEKELVEWITRLTRVNYPAHPSMVRYMAEHIRKRRVVGVNGPDQQHVHYDPIGEQWVSRFMGRYPELQTIIPRLIEAT